MSESSASKMPAIVHDGCQPLQEGGKVLLTEIPSARIARQGAACLIPVRGEARKARIDRFEPDEGFKPYHPPFRLWRSGKDACFRHSASSRRGSPTPTYSGHPFEHKHTYLYIYIYTYMYTYIYIYIYIHTHTHTHPTEIFRAEQIPAGPQGEDPARSGTARRPPRQISHEPSLNNDKYC